MSKQYINASTYPPPQKWTGADVKWWVSRVALGILARNLPCTSMHMGMQMGTFAAHGHAKDSIPLIPASRYIEDVVIPPTRVSIAFTCVVAVAFTAFIIWRSVPNVVLC